MNVRYAVGWHSTSGFRRPVSVAYAIPHTIAEAIIAVASPAQRFSRPANAMGITNAAADGVAGPYVHTQ